MHEVHATKVNFMHEVHVVGDKVVNAEVQTTSVMKKNLRMRVSEIQRERESKRDRHKGALYVFLNSNIYNNINN